MLQWVKAGLAFREVPVCAPLHRLPLRDPGKATFSSVGVSGVLPWDSQED